MFFAPSQQRLDKSADIKGQISPLFIVSKYVFFTSTSSKLSDFFISALKIALQTLLDALI